MWLKLANATFTTHLGSMASLANSYSVSYNLTGGITRNSCPSSIAKNQAGTQAANALTATFTLVGNATYQSISVTVGGTALNGITATTSGTTVSVTIPAASITANVVISIVATADTSGSGSGSGGTISYTITGTVTNGTPAIFSGTITSGGTFTQAISANSDYTLPNTVSITGTYGTATINNGTITISNVQSNLTVTVTCVANGSTPGNTTTCIISNALVTAAPSTAAGSTYSYAEQHIITAGTYLDHIDFIAADGANGAPTKLEIWLADASTNTVTAQIGSYTGGAPAVSTATETNGLSIYSISLNTTISTNSYLVVNGVRGGSKNSPAYISGRSIGAYSYYGSTPTVKQTQFIGTAISEGSTISFSSNYHICYAIYGIAPTST